MANDCCFRLKVVVKKDNKEAIERLKKILNYQDQEFCMYRLRSDTDVVGEYEDGDYFVCDFVGDSAWSCDPLFEYGDKPDVHLKEYAKDENGRMIEIKDENGNFKGYKENELPPHFTDLCHLAKVLDFGCELWCDEPGMCFAQHLGCNHNGELFIDETGHYEISYPEDENGEPDYGKEPIEDCEFEDFNEFAFTNEIY